MLYPFGNNAEFSENDQIEEYENAASTTPTASAIEAEAQTVQEDEFQDYQLILDSKEKVPYQGSTVNKDIPILSKKFKYQEDLHEFMQIENPEDPNSTNHISN